jgi:hypothetical protein
MYVVLMKINKKKFTVEPLFKNCRGKNQKSTVFCIQLKAILVFLLGFTLSSCPQHRLKVLFL